MNIQELAEKCNNVSINISLNDLEAFGNYLLEKKTKKLEEAIISDKAETYPTVKQVSEILHVDVVTLWRWNKKGYLKTIEIGGGRRYRMSDVKAILNSGRKTA